jgi:hypothetical protein
VFENFSLTGLSIDAFAEQVVGFLNNPFVVGAILALLALSIGLKIVTWFILPVTSADDDFWHDTAEVFREWKARRRAGLRS